MSENAGRGGGVLRGLEQLLGCLFYQKDCSKAFNKHSTEEKLSNQIHQEIKGYVWLNQAHRRSFNVSLLGNGNWFLTKVFCRSCNGWWIKFETTENLDRVYLRQTVIRFSTHISVSISLHTNIHLSIIQTHFIGFVWVTFGKRTKIPHSSTASLAVVIFSRLCWYQANR